LTQRDQTVAVLGHVDIGVAECALHQVSKDGASDCLGGHGNQPVTPQSAENKTWEQTREQYFAKLAEIITTVTGPLR
jgi:hypothetical protein